MSEEHPSRPDWAIALILLAISVCGIAAVGWKVLIAKPYYFRDPARLGNSTSYDNLMDETLLTIPDYAGILDSMTVDALFEYHRLNHDEVFESDEGKIWLENIAVAYGDFPEDDPNGNSTRVRVPAKFFDIDFNPLSEEEIIEVAPSEWNRNLDFKGTFPTIQFLFKGDSYQESKILDWKLYDARTHESLSSGYSSSGILTNGLRATFEPQHWHAAPIELMMDIAFGPPEIIEFPAEPGSRAKLPEGEITLVSKEINTEGLSTSHSGNSIELSIQRRGESPNRTTTSLLFIVLPTASSFPIDVELLDSEGTVVGSSGGTQSSYALLKTPEGEPDEFATVRVKYYSNRKRLIFHIPTIPGLPEQNQEIENLFDVRIPFVRIRDDYRFYEASVGLAQLRINGARPPNNAFVGPMIFEDITVKELVDEYAKLYGPTYGAEIDQENLTIEFLDMSLQAQAKRLWEDIKAKFD